MNPTFRPAALSPAQRRALAVLSLVPTTATKKARVGQSTRKQAHECVIAGTVVGPLADLGLADVYYDEAEALSGIHRRLVRLTGLGAKFAESDVVRKTRKEFYT